MNALIESCEIPFNMLFFPADKYFRVHVVAAILAFLCYNQDKDGISGKAHSAPRVDVNNSHSSQLVVTL